jgi:hypothetical protein
VRSDRVATVERATSVVLVDMGGGRRLTLDSFGSRVWTLLDDEPTIPLLLERLRDDQVSDRRLSDDVRRLIAAWEALGVISWR